MAFNPGDRVRRTGGEYRQVRPGETYTVKSDNDYSLRLEEDDVNTYSPQFFQLVETAPADSTLPPIGSFVRIKEYQHGLSAGRVYQVLGHEGNSMYRSTDLNGKRVIDYGTPSQRLNDPLGTHVSYFASSNVEILSTPDGSVTPADAEDPAKALADYKKFARDKIISEAREQGWSDKIPGWLEELGLDPLPALGSDVPDNLRVEGVVVSINYNGRSGYHAMLNRIGGLEQWTVYDSNGTVYDYVSFTRLMGMSPAMIVPGPAVAGSDLVTVRA